MLVLGGSLATASQEHALIAVINGNAVSIYETPLAQQSHRPQFAHTIHQITLNSIFATKVRTISFSPKTSLHEPRVLLASTNTVHIYSALPQTQPFHASITNAASPSTTLQSVSFITPDDILLVPELAPRITIRNIVTGLGVELREVKHAAASTSAFTNKTCSYSIRKKSGHVSFLTRPAVGKDVVVLFQPPEFGAGHGNTGWQVEAEFPVSTSDALGLSFSPDGFWLAVWDTASAVTNTESSIGSDVYIYTSTGKFYKSWKCSDREGDGELSLGIKTVDWLPDGRIAVGTADGRVMILAARTFEEEASISHPVVLQSAPDSANIYVEQIEPDSGMRSYAQATVPAAPPTATTESGPQGITHLAVSSDGNLLASVCAETPSTVHITSMKLNGMTTTTILIHHSPIRTIQWHPTKPSWLLTRTLQDRSQTMDRVYTWSDNLSEPMIVSALVPEVLQKTITSGNPSISPSSNPTASWVIPSDRAHPDAIPDILFTFGNGALCLPAMPVEDSNVEDTTILVPSNDDTPTRLPGLSSHRLTQKTPIRGHGPEDAFDASFEQLRAESDLAQSVSESVASVTDGGFSPVKFDATDWTRRQVVGEAGVDQDDTFVGKGRK